MKQATMVYKHPGKHEIHGSLFDYKVVSAVPEEEDGESQLDQALSDGWFLTTPEAKEGTPSDDQAPTRGELEAKAVELKVKFTKKTSDGELGALISVALKEGE